MSFNFSEESFLTTLHVKSDSFEKLLSSIITTGFKLSTLIGGGLMLYYCFKIGYFPTDLSISDTFIFIALSVVFGLFYGLTLLALKILFNLMFSSLLYLNVKYIKFNKTVAFSNFIRGKYKFSPDIIFGLVFTCLWLGFMLFIKIIDFFDILGVLAVFFVIVVFYEAMIIRIKEKRVNSGLGLKDVNSIREKEFLNISIFFIAILLLITLGMKVEGFVNSSMQILNLANMDVSVHVQQPYDQYLVEYDVNTNESSFGNDYVSSENVDVLMQGIGSNVVLSIPQKVENNNIGKVKIIIPRDKVHIIDKH